MLSYSEMEKVLMQELRLYHHPVAVTFLFTDDDVDEFKRVMEYVVPVKMMTFCQWEVVARMQNKTVLGTPEKLFCSNAKVGFGWLGVDADELKSQLKYCVDMEQAERFYATKPRMGRGELKAIGVSPLGKAVMPPSSVHFFCDSLQAYHLSIDYMAATDTHPLRPMLCMSSSCCGGNVYTYHEQTFNYCPPCSGAYNAGKTERGETNVMIPGSQIELVVKRLLDRVNACGGSSITRPGDPFPGGDICKNCPLFVFKKGASPSCASCTKK